MVTVQQKRFRRRLATHHLILFAASACTVALLYVTRPYRDVLTRLSFATAYPALVLLALTLVIGPWNILRGARNPVSGDLRRDIGMWAGVLGFLHALVGQNVHMRGRPWLYYVYEKRAAHLLPIRHDLFGFANHTGLVATLLLLMLLATSNDLSLRKLGTPKWKQLQRWNYAVFLLTAIHAFGYQGIENQEWGFVAVAVASVLITCILQGVGYVRRARAVRETAIAAR